LILPDFIASAVLLGSTYLSLRFWYQQQGEVKFKRKRARKITRIALA
jgi:hypothetical protein